MDKASPLVWGHHPWTWFTIYIGSRYKCEIERLFTSIWYCQRLVTTVESGAAKHKPCVYWSRFFLISEQLFNSCNPVRCQNISLVFDNPDFKCYQYAIIWYETTFGGFFCCHYFVSKVYCEVCLVYIKDHFSSFLFCDFYLGGGDRRVSLNSCE